MAHVFSEDLECKVPAKLMMSGLFLEAHSCLPKALPHKIAAVEYPSASGAGCVPGGIRHLKFHKDFVGTLGKHWHQIEALLKEDEKILGSAIHKVGGTGKEEVKHVEGELHKVAGDVKKESEKVGGLFHKAEKTGKKDVEKVEGELHKVGKTVVKEGEGVIKGAQKEGEELIGGAEKLGEGVVKGVVKEGQGVIGGGEKVGEKVFKGATVEGEDVIGGVKKAGEGVIGDVKKVEGGVIGGVKKEGESFEKLVKKEELFVKELIEELDHKACKIKICVIEGGLLCAFLNHHYKHTFEFKDNLEPHLGGSVLHWVTEFESIPKNAPKIYEEVRKDFLETFKGVEKYLLEHNDLGH